VTVFEGLPKGFQDILPELRQLVQKQDPVMGEAHLSRPGSSSSPDQPGIAHRMVRRSEGSSSE
jgi:hypothetical protein